MIRAKDADIGHPFCVEKSSVLWGSGYYLTFTKMVIHSYFFYVDLFCIED